jgi:hypothetical protein
MIMVHSHGELDESNGTVCEGEKKTAFIAGVRYFFPVRVSITHTQKFGHPPIKER